MSTQPALPEDFGRSWITLTRTVLLENADALGELDRRAGDGDFGANIRTAMKNLAREIDSERPGEYRAWVTCMSRAWLGVGGTSGPLLGMFFRDLAKAADGDDAADSTATAGHAAVPAGHAAEPAGHAASSAGAAPTLEAFTAALAAGQATVQKYGEAKVGDKTMVDAMAPAVTALRDALAAGDDATAALALGRQAAFDAAKGTAETTARRGRASYVGEASRGVIDPGAAAVALLIGAARAAAAGESDVDTSWLA